MTPFGVLFFLFSFLVLVFMFGISPHNHAQHVYMTSHDAPFHIFPLFWPILP